jgi:hypothetical protein
MESFSAPSAPAAEPADSSVARVAGVFVSPGRTFASIARRPGWVLPLLLSTLVSIALTIVLMPRIDFEAATRESLSARGETVSEERIEKIVATQKRFAGFGYAWGAVAPALVTLLLASVFWLSFKAFGWELSFRQSFGVTAHGFLPNVLASLVLLVFVGRLERMNLADLPGLVKSNLSFLVGRQENPVLHSLLQSVDLFSVWSLSLLVLGFALAAKVSRGRAAAVILTLWGLFVVGKAGLAALLS